MDLGVEEKERMCVSNVTEAIDIYRISSSQNYITRRNSEIESEKE